MTVLLRFRLIWVNTTQKKDGAQEVGVEIPIIKFFKLWINFTHIDTRMV